MSIVDTAAPPAPTEPRSRRKALVGVVVVLLLVAAAWWLLLRPAPADPAAQPGEVVKLDAIQVNLADGHYLRIGVALQASKEAGAEIDGSQALDATIELFSGRTMEQLSSKDYRNTLKDRLVDRLGEAYDGQVIGVYFTDFVTQ